MRASWPMLRNGSPMKNRTPRMKPRANEPQRPATGALDANTANLLARIDKNDLPVGYNGSRHQPYVDRIMAGLKPEQRVRVGQLWKEKRRLDSDIPNPGASFVKILTHIAEENQKSKQSNLMKAADNWVHWRGPNANGVAPSAEPPTHWSEKNNIRWKVPIDGAGASTPIIWKDKIFLCPWSIREKWTRPCLVRKINPRESLISLIRTLSLSFLFFAWIAKAGKSYGGGWLPA